MNLRNSYVKAMKKDSPEIRAIKVALNDYMIKHEGTCEVIVSITGYDEDMNSIDNALTVYGWQPDMNDTLEELGKLAFENGTKHLGAVDVRKASAALWASAALSGDD